MINRETIHNIKEKISIIDYATDIGLTPHQKGQYYSLIEYDSVRIDVERNCFWRNSCWTQGCSNNNSSGSIIDFAMHFEGLSRSEAYEKLTRYLQNNFVDNDFKVVSLIRKKREKKPFTLPKMHYKNNKICLSTAYSFLVKIRQIEPTVVKYFIHNNYLYEADDSDAKYGKNDIFYHCCVFVSYDKNKKAVFAQKRATNFEGNPKYKALTVEGSDNNFAFYIDNNSTSLIVTEGICDAMAVMSILKIKNRDFKNYNYLATTGVSKFQPILKHLKENTQINKLIVGFDNDEKGQKCRVLLREFLNNKDWKGEIIDYIPVNGKDHNDSLIELKKNLQISNVA